VTAGKQATTAYGDAETKRRARWMAAPKPSTLRHRNTAKAGRISSAAHQETEVARLTRELNEAREQQRATSEVLKVVSSSPDDLQPVFATMLGNAIRICEAKFGVLSPMRRWFQTRGLTWNFLLPRAIFGTTVKRRPRIRLTIRQCTRVGRVAAQQAVAP
jgi:hypothetical protein